MLVPDETQPMSENSQNLNTSNPVTTDQTGSDQGFRFTVKEVTFEDIDPIMLPDNPELQEILNDRISKIINVVNYRIGAVIEKVNDIQTSLDDQERTISGQHQLMKDSIAKVEQTNEVYDKNLNLARWVIVIVSLGSILLMLIIYLIWRGVVDVNKNEMEVVFANEDMKRKFAELLDQVEILNEQVNAPRKNVETINATTEENSANKESMIKSNENKEL
jgi:hypothetical protein